MKNTLTSLSLFSNLIFPWPKTKILWFLHGLEFPWHFPNCWTAGNQKKVSRKASNKKEYKVSDLEEQNSEDQV